MKVDTPCPRRSCFSWCCFAQLSRWPFDHRSFIGSATLRSAFMATNLLENTRSSTHAKFHFVMTRFVFQLASQFGE